MGTVVRFSALLLAYLVAEVASIVVLDRLAGGLDALITLVVAAGLGSVLLAGRGIATLRAAGAALLRGEQIAPVLLGGALIAAAGVLLIIPGLVSDALALGLLVPPVRERVAHGLIARFRRARARRRSQREPLPNPGDPPRSLP